MPNLKALPAAFTPTSCKKTEHFLSAAGSNCGIAYVNIGTSGAEIGGAFGAKKRLVVTENLAPTRGKLHASHYKYDQLWQ